MKNIFFATFFVALTCHSIAGEPEGKTHPEPPKKTSVSAFSNTRVVNGHSVETLWGKQLDFRIGHRFGDMATPGAASTLFGIDNATDIRIAFEYGITNRLNVGMGRSKGAGPQTQLLDGFIKYNMLRQSEDGSIPLSITLLGTTSFTMMKASTDSASPVAFHSGEWMQRLSYCSQILIARKFSDRFSLQIMPTYIHRNFVAYNDRNSLIAIGAGTRFKVTKVFALIAEYYYLPGGNRVANGTTYYNPAGLGFEFDTGGHVFTINLTNSAGIGETQFIPHTYSDMLNGEFRLGFTISRIFKF